MVYYAGIILTYTSILYIHAYAYSFNTSNSFLTLTNTSTKAAECPTNICYCLDIYVECTARNLNQIPNSLPHWTEKL